MNIAKWYLALVNSLTELELPLVKGWPAWDRPDVARPSLALLWSAAAPRRARLGGPALWQLSFDLYLTANHEDELLAVLSGFLSWLEGNQTLAAGDGERAGLALVRLERVAPPASIVAARFSAQATLTLEVVEE
jgi:hypothetical protein